MYFDDSAICEIFFRTNQLFGSVISKNDKSLTKYFDTSLQSLKVVTRFEKVLDETWGPGLYYSQYGAILRVHKKDMERKIEWLQDYKISPVSYIPYESVTCTEEENNVPIHYEELKVLAIVNTDVDVPVGQYFVKDILFTNDTFSSLRLYKSFIQEVTKQFGWVDTIHHPNTLLFIQQKNSQVSDLALRRMPGVTYTGVHKSPKPDERYYYYVGYGACLDRHNRQSEVYRAITDKLEINDSGFIKGDILPLPEEVRQNIFKFNEYGLCGLLIGTFCSFFMKERLKQLDILVPILGMVGLAGSGKSATLEHVLMPLMGMSSSDVLMASTIKQFALMRKAASSNMIPICIGEYKPNELGTNEKNLISNFINNNYDNAVMQRGRKDQQKNNNYVVRTPLILVGEGFKADKSKLERMVLSLFNELEIHRVPFKILQRHKKSLLSIGKSILMRALTIKDSDLLESFEANRYLIEEEMNSRCEANILCFCLGLDLFCEVLGICSEDIKKRAIQRYLTDTLTNRGTCINAIEEVLQDFSVMVEQKIITDGEWAEKRGYIWLNLASIYPKYLIFLKQQGQKALLTRLDFESQSLGFKTVIKGRERLSNYQNARYCIGFEKKWLEELSSSKQLDFSGFNVEFILREEEIKEERIAIENG